MKREGEVGVSVGTHGAILHLELHALLVAAQHAIRVAKFQDLSRKLNALQKAVAKKPVTTAALLDKLMEILRSYPLDVAEPDAPAAATGLG